MSSYKYIKVNTITSDNLLRVETSEGNIFYFRDIKGREIKQFEAKINEKLTVRECLELTGQLIHPRGNNKEDLFLTDFEIFEEIFQAVVDNIFSDMLSWFDFLELAFAMGKKSYSVLPWLLEQDMTTIWDMHHAMATYYKRENDYINEKNPGLYNEQ